MIELKLQKWPFDSIEFGNSDQIRFLQSQKEIMAKIKKFETMSASCVEINELTYYVAECPECRGESDPCETAEEAYDQIAVSIAVPGEGDRVRYLCRSCEHPLTQ
jgi:hypothetical protein